MCFRPHFIPKKKGFQSVFFGVNIDPQVDVSKADHSDANHYLKEGEGELTPSHLKHEGNTNSVNVLF